MATFVLIAGAGGDPAYWRWVVPQLEARGHEAVTVDLPGEDDSAGFDEYADVIVETVGDRKNVVLVAQSLAGFSAPMACDRIDAAMIIMVAAMTPKPGESAGEWWDASGQTEARRASDEALGRDPDAPFDPFFTFLHDVPPDRLAELPPEAVRRQSGTPFEKPWPLAKWPDVPTRFLLCQEDRLFPAEFQRRIVKQRLGITPDEMPGGHLPAFARPVELAERLVGYLRK
ncbi:alpha/beta hydrolase [Actinocrispum sp. NPDC049592]|uniref:alpha/beta hydrolase n=1 Tax=Actinocrispum sp. NPDC049592 TaxID=3154835 RepID=UPI0034292D35